MAKVTGKSPSLRVIQSQYNIYARGTFVLDSLRGGSTRFICHLTDISERVVYFD